MTATLDKESNDEIKSIMQKMIANVQVCYVIASSRETPLFKFQKGDAKASQVIINGLSDAQVRLVYCR